MAKTGKNKRKMAEVIVVNKNAHIMHWAVPTLPWVYAESSQCFFSNNAGMAETYK